MKKRAPHRFRHPAYGEGGRGGGGDNRLPAFSVAGFISGAGGG